MAKKGQKFRKWSKEEKLKIVKKHLNDHVPVKQLAEEENTETGMIARWTKEYIEDGEEGLSSHRSRCGNPYAALHVSKNLSEVERLRLVVAKQEIEIERLKKGYWVKGVGADKEYVTGNGVTLKSSKRSK
jgi:transposase-like protein